MRGSRWAAVITVAVFGAGAYALSQQDAPTAAAVDVSCYSHEAGEVADHGQVVNGNSVVLNGYNPGWIYGTEGYYSLLTITTQAGIRFIEEPTANQAYFGLDQGTIIFWEVCKARRGAIPTTTVLVTTTTAAATTTAPATTAPSTSSPPVATTSPPTVESTTLETTTTSGPPPDLDQDVVGTLPQTA